MNLSNVNQTDKHSPYKMAWFMIDEHKAHTRIQGDVFPAFQKSQSLWNNPIPHTAALRRHKMFETRTKKKSSPWHTFFSFSSFSYFTVFTYTFSAIHLLHLYKKVSQGLNIWERKNKSGCADSILFHLSFFSTQSLEFKMVRMKKNNKRRRAQMDSHAVYVI